MTSASVITQSSIDDLRLPVLKVARAVYILDLLLQHGHPLLELESFFCERCLDLVELREKLVLLENNINITVFKISRISRKIQKYPVNCLHVCLQFAHNVFSHCFALLQQIFI